LIGLALNGRTIDRLGDCVIVDRPLAESYTDRHDPSAKIGFIRVIRQRLFNTRNNMLEVREYTCRIVRVIDGDTIVVDIDLGYGLWQVGQSIRLRGIDAAETNDPDPRLRALAKYQREWLASKLEVGEVYSYSSYKTKAGDERDKYGRYVACFSELQDYPAVSYNGKISRDRLSHWHIALYESLVRNGRIEAVK
jgi:micrococcal nuclease